MCVCFVVFFFKQKTAYEMRISDWSSDVCSSDLALVADAGVDPAAIDDVIIGCVSQVGEQTFAFGRNIVLASSLPDSVPAVTIDRQCGSSQQAVHFAAQDRKSTRLNSSH